MSDIVTRLLLKTNDFDANLEKSKGSVNSFQDGIANATQIAGVGIAKFAGGIGLAVGAFEVFDKLVHSSQGTQDAFEWRMAACRETVDAFFHSLSSGDFSAFNQGIEDTYNNMLKLQQLRDDYADAKISNNVFRTQYQFKAQELKAIVSDNASSKAEKQKAANELKKITEAYAKQLSSTNDINVSQMMQNAQAKTGRYFSKEDIIRFFKVYNNPASLDEKKGAFDDYASKMNELKKKESHYETRIIGTGRHATTSTHEVINPEVQQQIKQLQKENNELDRMYLLSQHSDQTWEELSGSVIEYFTMQGEAAQNLNFLVKQQNKTDKATGGNGGSKEEPKTNSLAWYDSQISDQNKKLIAETDAQARGAIQATINELQQQKINLKFTVDQEAFKIAHGEMKDEGLLVPIKPTYNDKVPTHGKDSKNFKLPKHEPAFNKKDIGLNQDYAESLSAIGGVMSSLSGVTNESAAAYLQWGANVVSSIAQAIPAITSLITAKQTEAVVNGVASATETPVIGWLLAGAAVASVIAAMSSIPKFATGGIVPGTSFTGDKVPALLNSGEMILNGSQQSGLFRLLNGGVSGNLKQAISPSNNIQYISAPSNVTFRIHGRDLEGVLSNYHNQKTKVR